MSGNGGSRPPGRAAHVALAVAGVALVAAGLALDLPRASQAASTSSPGRPEFWGDSATYYAAAWSLARDLDLRYEAKDLERVRAEYPGGPQGLFLKRASGGFAVDSGGGFPWVRRVRPEEGRLYYAKGMAYPLIASPFVAALGTRGLIVVNAFLFSLALVLGFLALRRRGFTPGAALAVVGSLFCLSVAPVYLVWPSPEILGLALVTAGLWAWIAERPLLSALLFGLAGYLKPPNLVMSAPLVLEPLWPQRDGSGSSEVFARLRRVLARGLLAVAATLVFYGVNAAVTGEANYQGGERKTFYGRFPFDAGGGSFDSAGSPMTTNQIGPLVEGRDDARVTAESGPARKRAELLETLGLNLAYFWVGRFGGALAYFLSSVVALLAFLLAGPREKRGWLSLLAVVLSWIAYIWIIPDNWYGGGGTVGNRYFLNLLPAFLFLVPVPRGRWVVAGGVLSVLVFLGPAGATTEHAADQGVLVSPVLHSCRPGEHALRPAFKLLPAELTMLNDLSVFTEPWRKKRPFGFVGNETRPADPDAYFLYFTDDGTFGKEEWAGRPGFWLRAERPAEVVVRAFDLAWVDQIVVRLTGGPLGDTVDCGLGGRRERVRLGPGQVREVALTAGQGVPYYDTYVHVLHLRSHRGAPLADGRRVGAWIDLRLVMRPRLAKAR